MLAASILSVSGCDTGTPPYWGREPVRAQVGEMVFDIRQNGLMAEALRQNMMVWPGDEAVARAAAVAIVRVTGCAVLELRGDPSVIEARLNCAGQKAPKFGSKRVSVFCEVGAHRKMPERPEDYYLICR